jgi:hypothetical protein
MTIEQRGGDAVQFNYPYKPHLGPPPQPPRPPRPPNLAMTNHVLWFLLGLFTFGFFWAVWLFVALVNDVANRREMREYDRRLQQYREWMRLYEGALWDWQNRHYEIYGFVPPRPPGM